MEHVFEKPASPLFQSTPNSFKRLRSKRADSPHVSKQALTFPALEESDTPNEDSGLGPSAISDSSTSTEPVEPVSCPLTKKINAIEKKAQDLIERINQSRSMDQHLMSNFEETLIKKVSETCQELKDCMFHHFEEQSRIMEAPLEELSEVLGRSSQLTLDLQGASQTLATINRTLHHTA